MDFSNLTKQISGRNSQYQIAGSILRYATVSSVQTDGTCTIVMSGDSVARAGIKFLSPPLAGMVVTVLQTGTDIIIIGPFRAWGEPWGVIAKAQATSDQGGITTVTDLTGLTANFTPPANRIYKVSGFGICESNTSNDFVGLSIDKNGTQIATTSTRLTLGGGGEDVELFTYFVTTAVSTTVKLRLARITGSGTVTTRAGTTYPFTFLVEDIGPSAAP